mmetsp:Transcript_16068/g.47142  ORF Transcript_16068/g.47142 Transcript_16068/m.47142 type:complete len:203 (-) Transcript_16068:38-646(-)
MGRDSISLGIGFPDSAPCVLLVLLWCVLGFSDHFLQGVESGRPHILGVLFVALVGTFDSWFSFSGPTTLLLHLLKFGEHTFLLLSHGLFDGLSAHSMQRAPLRIGFLHNAKLVVLVARASASQAPKALRHSLCSESKLGTQFLHKVLLVLECNRSKWQRRWFFPRVDDRFVHDAKALVSSSLPFVGYGHRGDFGSRGRGVRR